MSAAAVVVEKSKLVTLGGRPVTLGDPGAVTRWLEHKAEYCGYIHGAVVPDITQHSYHEETHLLMTYGEYAAGAYADRRVWLFRRKSGRDQFVLDYAEAGAVVSDPPVVEISDEEVVRHISRFAVWQQNHISRHSEDDLRSLVPLMNHFDQWPGGVKLTYEQLFAAEALLSASFHNFPRGLFTAHKRFEPTEG